MSDAALISGESSDSPFLYPASLWARVEARFWSKVDKSGDCWEWRASGLPSGYGKFGVGQGKKKLAHRVSFELTNGRIPDGLVIDHTCHNTSRVNPKHLRAVTRKQNSENRSGPAARSSSGVRGVHWDKKSRKWRGQVGHGGKSYVAGRFDTIAEGEAAVVAMRNRLFTHSDNDRSAA